MEILVLVLVGHFLPSIIALARGHHNGFAIFLTNLLLGWTVIGWVVALIWSTTAIQRRGQTVSV
ncbi:MAG: superinfection immunity protein [Caulobacterales bacterium]|uniref:superinfection immunity protein n=1 Tax=Glycocaulis sp. TaxID=1969725 RepID=UPI003F9F6760